MEQMIELKKIDQDRSIVLWVHPEGHKEFVVCSHYNDLLPMGQRWDWGHYFLDLFEAIDYVNEENREV